MAPEAGRAVPARREPKGGAPLAHHGGPVRAALPVRVAAGVLATLCLLTACRASAQSLSISTLAGSAPAGTNDGTGASARFANPWGVAVDGSGNVYVADTDNHTIRKIAVGGTVTTLAGQPGVSGSANGTGSGALFNEPQGLAIDGVGNVYVADSGNHLIRKVTPGGLVTTVAGVAGVSGTNDGAANLAHFASPEGLVVNSAGTVFYVADTWNHTIRKIALATGVTTLAGSPTTAGTNDGTGSLALFNQPQGMAVDSGGNLYVGDTGNHTIRKVTGTGVVTTVAGTGGIYGSVNASGAAASFWGPQGVAVDGSGNIYVADAFNHTIRKVSGGAVTTYAGTAGSFGSADGTGAAARFWLPQGVAVDSTGTLYVADSGNGTIRKIASGAVVTTLAGSASAGSVDGAGSSARFNGPTGAAIDSAGNRYIADTGNGTIRKASAGGPVSTLAGLAGSFGSIDGATNAARFLGPQGVAVGSDGTVYVADTGNHTIRKITTGGTVSTLAGSVGNSGPDDGTGTAARFNSPQDLAVDASGNVYVADTWNHTIRKVTAGGVVTTFAGVPGLYGNLDDGDAGNGTNEARFYCPSGVAVDGSGNVYVADTRNHTIRKVTASGTVSTVAGLAGTWGYADGTNNGALFNLPQAVTLDSLGNLYVLDSGNHAIRKVSLVGSDWVVSTVAGWPGVSGSADGVGLAARFLYPAGLAVNNNGAFAVADWGNNTLRAGVPDVSAPPSIVAQPQNVSTNQGQPASFSVMADGSVPLSYQWRLYGTNLSGATASTYVIASAQPTNAGPYAVVVTNSLGSITSVTAQLTVVVPPTLTSIPQSQTVYQYSNATFTVSASGTAPSYQWLFNGGSIAGATASSFTKVNVQPGDAGSYSVVVFNSAGSTNSPAATLTVTPVPAGPSISTPPQSQSVAVSSNATFSVAVNGTTPLSYQWRFYGTNLSGATASSYTVANVRDANGGPYLVVVTNAYGAATSAPATLTVLHPPIISVQPQTQLASVSNSVSFTVALSQGPNPAYQWRQNGSPIAGATQSSYTIASVLWTDAGTYSVVVTNSDGGTVSAGAQLIVQQAPLTWFDGFENDAVGVLDNNWGGLNATTSNFWWSASQATQGYVTNASTGVTPHGGTHMAGRSGSGFLQDYVNLLYRLNAGQPYYGNFLLDWWFYDPYGTGVGATSYADYMVLGSYAPVSTTSDPTTGGFSIYQRMSLGAYNGSGYNSSVYQARIIGGAGNFGSGNSWYNTATPRTAGWHHARVVFGIPNAANYAPVWMYIDNMTNATVYSPTSGTNTGINILEMNHANANSGYYDDFTFRADNDPWIVEQPVDQAVNLGQSASFNTVAIGTAYQWQFNGKNIAGATTSAYSIPSVASTNGGVYACVVWGANGTLSTAPAVLSILNQPANPGQFTSLSRTNGLLQLSMSGTPYTNYVLEYTTDYKNWTQLSTLSGPTGTFQYTDPTPPTNGGRFYRLRVGP